MLKYEIENCKPVPLKQLKPGDFFTRDGKEILYLARHEHNGKLYIIIFETSSLIPYERWKIYGPDFFKLEQVEPAVFKIVDNKCQQEETKKQLQHNIDDPPYTPDEGKLSQSWDCPRCNLENMPEDGFCVNCNWPDK